MRGPIDLANAPDWDLIGRQGCWSLPSGDPMFPCGAWVQNPGMDPHRQGGPLQMAERLEWIDFRDIVEAAHPPHEVYEGTSLVQRIALSFRRYGWVGRPLLIWDDPDGGWHLLTGSHRYEAMRSLYRSPGFEMQVPAVFTDAFLDEWFSYPDLLPQLERQDPLAAALLKEQIRANREEFQGTSDRGVLSNPRQGPEPAPWLTLREIGLMEPLAQERGVSEVARGRGGFLEAYRRAGGNPWKVPEKWVRKRAGFIKRHMAQVLKRMEPLYEADWAPTRRHLALIMWAYSPG